LLKTVLRFAGGSPGRERKREMATMVVGDERVSVAASAGTQPSGGFTATARASWPTVRIETDGATYEGQVCVPETKRRLTDALADDRPFLHLVQVSINGAVEREPFLALNKRFIRTVRIVDEGKRAELVLVPPSD
jgi:hypothetical protein